MREEVAKIAASWGRMAIPPTRSGRKPISMENLLKLDAEGRLIKRADKTSDGGSYVPIAKLDAAGWGAKAQKRKGDSVSVDSDVTVQPQDGRNEATTITSPATVMSGLSSAVGQVERSW